MTLRINFYVIILLMVLATMLSCSKEEEEKEEKIINRGDIIYQESYYPTPSKHTEGTVNVAKWQGNRKAAVTLQFDDSTAGACYVGFARIY